MTEKKKNYDNHEKKEKKKVMFSMLCAKMLCAWNDTRVTQIKLLEAATGIISARATQWVPDKILN